MKVSYEKLWVKMKRKKMNKTVLIQKTGMSTSTMAKLVKNEPVALPILMRVCEVLDCNVGDVVDFVKE